MDDERLRDGVPDAGLRNCVKDDGLKFQCRFTCFKILFLFSRPIASSSSRMSSFEGSKWAFARDVDHFRERAGKEPDKALLLCSEPEMADQTWAGVKHRFTAAAALTFLCRVQAAATTAGACGR